MTTLTTFLTFDDQAEAAADLYLSIFDQGKKGEVRRMGTSSEAKVMTVSFELFGRPFIALNGGPKFSFSQGISLFVSCDTQDEVDRYWDRLVEHGATPVQCGWITDKFGVSWQIVPAGMLDYLGHADREKASRAMAAMLQMQKLDLAGVKRAFDGA
jgi:predicted 3-demethylubiquinone-9 3-methyltransferase (glyoxalase superfamily)